MNLSISNIGWTEEQDRQVYEMMSKYDISGLEIAPTRIFTEKPYEKLEEAKTWAKKIKSTYGFCISSMQSIWYGREERIFGTEEEYKFLVEYSKKAVDFAVAIDCKNLVFGCPRNRSIPDNADTSIGIRFFKEIGEYAVNKGTVIGMEANPPIYNTNYINDTISAFALIEKVNSEGFKLNLDIGTMIYNQECVEKLREKVHLINHIHVSEPNLKPIEKRKIHEDLYQLLLDEKYQGFVSIEMGRVTDTAILEETINYVRSVFSCIR